MKQIYFLTGMVFIFMCLHTAISAQSSFGGYPSRLGWNQINTDKVRVIFPDSLEDKARRVANIVHYMNDKNVGLLGKNRKKVDIILQNQQVISNGFAQVAPFKTEFFHQAPQDTYGESSIDWMDLLALHEYRHVNQFTNSRQGLSKVLYYLIGDYGWAAAIGLTAPAWFLEGDAVVNETALSASGRGRIPSFSVNTRALADAGVNYKVMKALSGSYKDMVPDHYETGYLISSEIRRTHGNESWDRITKRASNFRGIIGPFSRAVNKVTGEKVKNHYYNAYQKMVESLPEVSTTSQPITAERKKDVVNYKYPIINDGQIYFSMATRRHVRGIYRYRENEDDQLIVRQGLILDAYFSKAGPLFAWSEFQRDIRRGNVNYSNIILFNEETGKKTLIGRNERYFSPSLNADGSKICFIAGSTNSRSSIHILDLNSNIKKEVVASDEIQFLYPSFSLDGNVLYAIIKKKHDFALAAITLDGEINLLTEWDLIVFGPPKQSGEYLIFNANYDAVDNIYALDLHNGMIKKVTNDAVGMYHPSHMENGYFVAERPHQRGVLIHKVVTSPESWTIINKERRSEVPYYLETEHLEGYDILEEVENNQFEISKYPRNLKSMNIHSWVVSSNGSDEFSATIFSNNILNTVTIQPSFTYNTNIQGAQVDVGIRNGRYFPIYALDFNYALPRTQNSSDGERSFTVSQVAVRPGFEIPLNLTKGLYNTILRFNNAVAFQQINAQNQETLEEINQSAITLNNIISFQSTRITPIQNYYPKWGIVSSIYNRYRTNDNHNAFLITNDFYLPGLHPNHGFKIEVDFVKRNETADDRLPHFDNFNYAEGFRAVEHDQIFSVNTNYGFPVAYPDWGFWNFIYFKRINSVLFHNFNRVTFESEHTDLQSMGADVLFDLVFNNNVFSEISAGFRGAYMVGPLPAGKKTPYHFEFIVNIPAF